MELLDVLKVAGGGAGGMLATILLYVKVLGTRLDKIEGKVDKINGSVAEHNVRLALLERKPE